MIYEQIDDQIKAQLDDINLEALRLSNAIERLKEKIATEDSKRRETEMMQELSNLRVEQRKLWGLRDSLRAEAFKDLLAREYGLPRSHPKFEKVYALAYDRGHGFGCSEIELNFMGLVELVK